MAETARTAMDEALGRAVANFNVGAYKDALDDFEVPYHLASRAQRPLYLGLIRAAAALYHFERGQPVSALKLYRSGRELLARASAPTWSLPVLLAELDAVFAPLLAAPADEAPRLRPERRPHLTLASGPGEPRG